MIESLEPVEKKQFLDLANYLQRWLSSHPHAEEDDDSHRQMRMYAMTYLRLYEEFIKLYKYVVTAEYIDKKTTPRIH
jgi:hypothetical protein